MIIIYLRQRQVAANHFELLAKCIQVTEICLNKVTTVNDHAVMIYQ